MSEVQPQADAAKGAGAAAPPRRAHIGSYVLETLTIGMYGEPRHTIREYIQNAYDSIRRARKNRLLPESGGLVTITFDETNGTLTVEDNGTGIPATSAWGILSSVGASSKDRRQQAGFRGIGRLAGIAYCDELRFVAKYAGELEETTVTFDCVRLREAMDPDRSEGEDIQDLLAEAVTEHPRLVDAAERAKHYMRVEMDGLSNAPREITDIGLLRTYLVQTSPVDYGSEWPFRDQIRRLAEAAGQPLEPIAVRLVHRTPAPPVESEADAPTDSENEPAVLEVRESTHDILKPYSALVKPAARKPVSVSGVREIRDPASPPKWWGWIGQHQVLGALTDEGRGLRVRVRDIQIDGTVITDNMFAAIKSSYDRFNEWHIGEIHVVTSDAIPNARRDGFEENATWAAIQREVSPTLRDLASKTYKSSSRRSKIRKLTEKVETYLTAASDSLVPDLTEVRQQQLIASAREVAGEIADVAGQDLLSAEDGEVLTALTARVNSMRRRIEDAEATAPGETVVTLSAADLLGVVYDALSDMLEPSLYRRIRRRIEDDVARRQG